MTAQEFHKEVRIALVLYGGVAMATYIYGACHELYQLVRAANGDPDSPYRAIVDDLKANVVIDVISGASAGGLNGAALAKALATGADFGKLERFWIEQGQVQQLLNNPRRPALESLLDERYYARQLQVALGELDAGPGDQPLVPSVDLFIATTDLHGRGVAFPAFDNSQVYTKTHEHPYHLRYRQGGANDFVDGALPYRLWELCQASSAFPMAFPPAAVKDERGSRRYLTDGGILNNFPFEQVIEAIATRPADVYVDRALFYVEPDPGFGKQEYMQLQGDQAPVPPDQVLRRALFGIPSFESVTEALQRLRQHNVEVGVRAESARLVEEWFEQEYLAKGRATSTRLDPKEYEAFKASPLARAYQAWKRVQVYQALTRWLMDANPTLDMGKVRQALEQAHDTDPVDFYRAFDAEFRVRRYYYLTRELIRVIREVEMPSTAGLRAFAAFPAQVPEGSVLGKLLEFKAAMLQLAADSRQVPVQVRAALSSGGPPTDATLPDYLARARAEYLARFAAINARGLALVQEVDSALVAAGYSQHARFQLMSDSFELRDAFLFPMSHGEGLGERDYVDLVPVSPAVGTYIRVPHRNKLAGELLFHFGGFFRKEWRQNDIMWGRLDAAEVIVDFLLPRIPQASRKSRESYLRPLQEAIVLQNPSLTTGFQKGDDYRAYLERRYSVGMETFAVIPPQELVPVATQTLGVVHGIVEHLKGLRSGHPVLGMAYGGAARVLGLLNNVANPLTALVFPRSNLVKAAVALLMVLALGWSLGTLIVHFINFQEVSTSTVVLAVLLVFLSFTVGGFYYRLTWRRFAFLTVVLLLLLAAAAVDIRYAERINDFVAGTSP